MFDCDFGFMDWYLVSGFVAVWAIAHVSYVLGGF